MPLRPPSYDTNLRSGTGTGLHPIGGRPELADPIPQRQRELLRDKR